MKRLVPSSVLILAILLGCRGAGTPSAEKVTPIPSPTPTLIEPTPTLPSPTPTVGKPPTAVVAMVNGQPIPTADYEERVAQFQKALIEQGFDPESEGGKARLEGVRRQVLEQMINEVLIEQAAAEEGIAIPQEELEAEIQREMEMAGGQESFDEQLEASGMTIEDYREMLRRDMLTWELMEKVTGPILTTAEQVHARHILVEAEDEAQEILARLQGGEDFALLAEKNSQDEFTKDNGGDLGWFPKGGLIIAPRLEEAAFSLSPGERRIVHSQWGYHVLEVLEKDLKHPLSPEMANEIRRNRWLEWLRRRREEANIERFLEE